MASIPDKRGRFGNYGGRYVPETLMPAFLNSKRCTSPFGRIVAFKKSFENVSNNTSAGLPRCTLQNN